MKRLTILKIVLTLTFLFLQIKFVQGQNKPSIFFEQTIDNQSIVYKHSRIDFTQLVHLIQFKQIPIKILYGNRVFKHSIIKTSSNSYASNNYTLLNNKNSKNIIVKLSSASIQLLEGKLNAIPEFYSLSKNIFK